MLEARGLREHGHGSKEGGAQRIMRGPGNGWVICSVQSLSKRGSRLKRLSSSLGFIGMASQSEGHVDGKVKRCPLRGSDSRVVAGEPGMRVGMKPKGVSFVKKMGRGNLMGEVGRVNS